MSQQGKKVHMMAIGGAGMSIMAAVMAQMGYRISGCDIRPGAVTDKLRELGIEVFEGHDPSHVAGTDLVIYSAAIKEDNPELIAAREAGIEVISRARMLGRLMADKSGIAVAGTHGKTTTTSMVGLLLVEAGLDPTVLTADGDLDIHGNARLGKSGLFLTEACEAFKSFHELHPQIAVVANIEAEHLDCYHSIEGVMGGFRQFLSQIKKGGLAVVCSDCPNARAVIPSIGERVVTYGLTEDADYRAYNLDVSTKTPSFEVAARGRHLEEFRLQVPGQHNVLNALAAIAVANELGLDPEVMKEALWKFRGAARRFEELGTAKGVTVIDDYAHHPTEVKATLAAARAWGRRTIAIFQPHLYSRTEFFANDFAKALSAADQVIITDIYAAREQPMPGVSGKMIADRIPHAQFIPDKEKIAGELIPNLQSGDLVVVMGAGDIRATAEEILERLKSNE